MLLDSLSPKQLEILNSESDITFCSCGAGSGFSTIANIACSKAEKSLVITDTSGMLYSYKDCSADKCQAQKLHWTTGILYDTVVIEQQNLPLDIFRKLPKFKKLLIRACPTLNSDSPLYKIAKSLIIDGKKYITFNNGFPFLAYNQASLHDVFGAHGYSINLMRATYEDNPWNSSDEGEEYVDLLESLCKRDRKIYMHGLWDFE